MSVTIQFNDVIPKPYNENPLSMLDLFKKKFEDDPSYQFESMRGSGTIYGNECHGLFWGAHVASANSLDLELSPDHFKLLILQGFAIHLNQNLEKFKLNKDGKVLVIDINDYKKGSIDTDWGKILKFYNECELGLEDNILAAMILCSPSTSCITDTIACTKSILHTDTIPSRNFVPKEHFEGPGLYVIGGIRRVKLLGTISDWKMLCGLVEYIKKYDLEWWVSKIKPILDKIILAVEGQIDVVFWRSMFTETTIHVGQFTNGWLTYFCPYLIIPNENKYTKNNFSYMQFNFPTGITNTSIKWSHETQFSDMLLSSGFYGFSIKDWLVRPEISLIVHTVVPKVISKPSSETEELALKAGCSKELFETYTKGTYYNESSDHYNGINGVTCAYCDMCDLVIPEKHPAIGFTTPSKKYYDLCMECVVLIKNKLYPVLRQKASLHGKLDIDRWAMMDDNRSAPMEQSTNCNNKKECPDSANPTKFLFNFGC